VIHPMFINGFACSFIHPTTAGFLHVPTTTITYLFHHFYLQLASQFSFVFSFFALYFWWMGSHPWFLFMGFFFYLFFTCLNIVRTSPHVALKWFVQSTLDKV
jgi:hypothetical protein